MQPTQNEKSTTQKLLALIGLLILCSIVGSVLLLGLAAIGGMDLARDMDVFSAVTDPSLRPYIKGGIGLNHLAMFSGTALLFAYWLRGHNWRSYFDTVTVDFDLLGKFFLLLLLSYPLIGLSAVALEHIDLPAWADAMDDASIDSLMKMLQMDGPLDLLVNLIIIAVIPAVGEELLFRGVIQNELLKKIVNPHVAILIASIIFSGFHLQIQGFLPKLIIGLILGYAYYWTKSLWYPMILHFVNNAMQTVLLYLAGEDLEAMEEKAETPETLYLAIVVAFSCFLCYFLVQNIRKQTSLQKQESV